MGSRETNRSGGRGRGDEPAGDTERMLVVGISADQFATLPGYRREGVEREYAHEIPVEREPGAGDAAEGQGTAESSIVEPGKKRTLAEGHPPPLPETGGARGEPRRDAR